MGGIVLAGGKSRRMGRDKALLPYGDTILLAHVVSVVRSVAGPTFIVADVAGKYNLPDGTVVLGDAYPNTGPLGGLITGLEAAATERNLVVACDMPGLQPPLLQFLLAMAEGYDAAIPIVDGRMEPLCAAYGEGSGGRLKAALESGERAIHKAVERLNVRFLAEETLREHDPDLASFRNFNTPEDAAELR